MSEREFIIQEAQGHSPYFVKESELLNRLWKIRCLYYDDAIRKQGIPILLHGEGEKYDEKPWPGPEDIIKMRGKPSPAPTREQSEAEYLRKHKTKPYPSPAPTRAEWEKWIGKIPMSIWTKQVQEWFLSMPIVPKG